MNSDLGGSFGIRQHYQVLSYIQFTDHFLGSREISRVTLNQEPGNVLKIIQKVEKNPYEDTSMNACRLVEFTLFLLLYFPVLLLNVFLKMKL